MEIAKNPMMTAAKDRPTREARLLVRQSVSVRQFKGREARH